mgnify:CR=1
MSRRVIAPLVVCDRHEREGGHRWAHQRTGNQSVPPKPTAPTTIGFAASALTG